MSLLDEPVPPAEPATEPVAEPPDDRAEPAGGAPPAGSPANPRRARRRLLAGVAVLGVAALVGGASLLGPRLKSPDQVAADAAPPSASVVTATVERRRIGEPVVLRGKVKPGPSVALKPPAAAVGESSVVTSVHVRKGERIAEGQVLLVRAGEPMLVLRMPFAPYRDLAPGMTGPDVEAVQEALRRLGYTTGKEGKFDARTQAAVKKLYSDRGHSPPQPADTGDSGAQPKPNAVPSTPSASPSPGLTLPRSAIVPMRKTGQLVTKVRVKVGSVLSDANAALLELDGGDPFIETLAGADQVDLLRKGQEAKVTDDVAGRTAEARLTSVGTKVVNDGRDGASGYPVRLEFTGAALAAAEDRTVRIDVQVAEVDDEVLAVPVTAVFSRPDGSTFVTVLAGDRRSDVTVTAGTTAGGWVEITDATPDVLKPGVQVVVSERGTGSTGAGD